MKEYWRGGVEAWEADEMGHMNVRFWVKRALEAISVMSADLGVERAFAREATATLLPLRQHIRFHKEAHPGAPLFYRGGVIALGETDITLYGEIVHETDQAIGATFITTLSHVEAKTGRPFAWPQRTAALIEALKVEIPSHGAARSLDFDAPIPCVDITQLEEIGYKRVGLGAVRSDETDGFDRIFAEQFMGRVSNAVPNILNSWRQEATLEVSQADGVERKAGGAVVEYRLDYLAWPGAGDFIAIHSGIKDVGDKTLTLRHVILDPISLFPWCICEVVAVTFDLVRRKVIPNPPKAKAALQARALKSI